MTMTAIRHCERSMLELASGRTFLFRLSRLVIFNMSLHSEQSDRRKYLVCLYQGSRMCNRKLNKYMSFFNNINVTSQSTNIISATKEKQFLHWALGVS